ncbi:MAG: hypothetical protein EAZ61_07185 [Oscillatoriales cyanobacterium]|nr:MAG: hypothetical protein EAZ61_07185 [Oscillatoriales cyanobacterium]
MIGVSYSGWFLYKKFLFARDRQRTIDQFNAYKARLFGNAPVILTSASEPIAALPVVEEVPLTPSSPVEAANLTEPEPIADLAIKTDTPDVPDAEPIKEAPEPVVAPEPTAPEFVSTGNGVDELRYLFICSQVELVTTPEALSDSEYREMTDTCGVAIVVADGEKCERCWNYSDKVGTNPEHPTLCERCVPAINGHF